jgi:hypothetical protein
MISSFLILRNLGNLVLKKPSLQGARILLPSMRGDMNAQAADHDQLVVSPRRAAQMLDCGNTKIYELLNNKELDSYLDGRSRKVTVASIHRRIARKLGAGDNAPSKALSKPRLRGRPRETAGSDVRS